MNHKKCLTLSATLVLTVALLAWLYFAIVSKDSFPTLSHRETSDKTRKSVNNNIEVKQIPEKDQLHIPNKEERLRMNAKERIAVLERLGYVPDNPDMSDYFYAEKTSWWGNKLDTITFWSNRVVWLDEKATFDARRRGRAYPPIPYDEPAVAHNSDIDEGGDGGYASLDGGWQPGGKFSDKERIFWDNFQKTHPHPPSNIQRWLDDRADRWLNTKLEMDNNLNTGKSNNRVSRSLDNLLFLANRDANDFGYPPECVSPEVFYWNHIMRKRAEYEEFVESGRIENPLLVDPFFNRVYVDRTLITEPLTQNQIDTANAWKVAYLNRLRTEKWDESYINAYLDAWDLTEGYVFGTEKDK